MKGLKIFFKLFISHATIGLLSVLVISFLFYSTLRNSLIQRTVDQLSSINILKKNQIENYFSRTQKNLLFLFNDKHHLNPERVSNDISEFAKLYEFENVSLIDTSLHTVYSSSSDTAFFESIRKSNLLDTSIKLRTSSFQIWDGSNHDSSKNTLLIYIIALPERNSSKTSYLFIKEKFEKIQNILFERTGMGSTGESYIVGSDSLMRSASRFYPAKPPLTIPVKSEALKAFQQGGNNKFMIQDYRYEDVLSIHRRLDQQDLSWVIISEIDFKEAMKPINELKNYFILITILIIGLIFVITFFISNAISKPILFLKENILSLSKGIIPERNGYTSNTDEVGQIANATNKLIEGLKHTSDFANEIGSGNFNASFTKLSEKDTLGTSLITMRDKLKAFNERELRLVREKGAALMEGQENERKRIIRELHDGIGQLLTVVKLRLEVMEGQDELKTEIKQLINETIAEVRRISYNVMPNALVDFGLEAALKGLCENIKKYSKLSIDFTYVKESDVNLNFEISIAVFRIVQEGLNNIIKHAHASQVNLYVVENEDRIYFMLKDNGVGFDKEKIYVKRGFGLTSMKERAKLLNGEWDIQSVSGEGTVIEVNIPINRE